MYITHCRDLFNYIVIFLHFFLRAPEICTFSSREEGILRTGAVHRTLWAEFVLLDVLYVVVLEWL